MENKFEGKYLGKLGDIIGDNSAIQIDEVDCWLNYSRNITLIINNGEKKFICSQTLSELIRKNNLDEETEVLKKYSVYEFIDGSKYVTHIIENRSQLDNHEFDAIKSQLDLKVKVLTENNELYITQQNRKDKVVYLTISESKVNEIIDSILYQVSQSDINIKFSREELMQAFKTLPLHSHNTSVLLKNNFYLGKQASIFNNLSEVRFTIFGNGRIALVKAICDVRYFE